VTRGLGSALLFALYCWAVWLLVTERGSVSVINALGLLAWVLMIALWWDRVGGLLLTPVQRKEKTRETA
jgi:hypothetical protein